MKQINLDSMSDVALYTDIFTELIRQCLKRSRFEHSVNVGDMCEQLAITHGYKRPDVAKLTGIIHDVRKNADAALLKYETRQAGSIGILRIPPHDVEIATPALHHAVAGAYYAYTALGITDTDVINAIRFHTVGRAAMTMLEQIVYLGDVVSRERNYPDVKLYREMAYENLDKACHAVMAYTIKHTIERGGAIPDSCFQGYNYYLEKI